MFQDPHPNSFCSVLIIWGGESEGFVWYIAYLKMTGGHVHEWQPLIIIVSKFLIILFVSCICGSIKHLILADEYLDLCCKPKMTDPEIAGLRSGRIFAGHRLEQFELTHTS